MDIPVTLACSLCPEGEKFKVPVGTEGIATMREHLRQEHDIPEPVAPPCPGCAQPAKYVMTDQAFCGNDDCRVIAWNPTKTMDEMMDNSQVVEFGD